MKDRTCLSGDNLIEMKRTDGLVACSKYNNNCDASIYLSILKMMHVKKLQTPSVSFGLLFQQETSVTVLTPNTNKLWISLYKVILKAWVL